MPNLWVLSILKLSGTILSSSEQNADELMIFLKVSFPLKFKSINPNSLFLKSFIEEFFTNSKLIQFLGLKSLAEPNNSTDTFNKKYSLKN